MSAEHVLDDLDLYAIGALSEVEAARVTLHLEGCLACRVEAARLYTVVDALATTLAEREPSTKLRERVLASARAERAGALAPAAPRPRLHRARFLPSWTPVAALSAAVLLLVAVDVRAMSDLAAAQEERDEYTALAVQLSHAGRSWYMAGTDQWRGSGGTLVVPAADGTEAAFVLFHDLKPLAAGQVYSLWLVSGEGKWIHGPSFTADGRRLQKQDLDQRPDGFARCVVTIESPNAAGTGGRTVVMQSRIAPAP